MSKSKLLTTLVVVSVLVLTSAVTSASARWHGRWHGGGWRGAGVAAAIGAGLALGAAAAYRGGYGYSYPSYYGYGYPFLTTGTGMVVVVAGALPPRLTADTARSHPRQQLNDRFRLPLADAARGADAASIEPGRDGLLAGRHSALRSAHPCPPGYEVFSLTGR